MRTKSPSTNPTAPEAPPTAQPPRHDRRAWLGGVVMLVALVTTIAVVITNPGSGGVERKPGERVAGQFMTRRLLTGIPQSQRTLGDPAAKATIVEFADLQCPICKQFAAKVLPQVIEDEVRTGRAKLELRLVDILDRGTSDSARMAAMAYGARLQDRMWDFAEIAFVNQGVERSGYADDAFLRRVASGVRGLDIARAFTARSAPGARAALIRDRALFDRAGATGTPTIVVGPTGGELKKVGRADAGAIHKAVTKALGE